jgi:iron complex transport system substrate-binding protein
VKPLRSLLPAVAAAGLLAGGAEARPLRAMGLDQCADQYLLALRPDADLALSPRADDADARLRRAAEGRRRVRPTLEAAVAFDPDVVVRYWGGEPRLLRRLEAEGVRVATIGDAANFAGVRRNIRSVAAALEVPARGERLIARMDARLAEAAPARAADRPSALYLTAGGFTAGKGTLVDAVLAAAGLANAAVRPFFQPVSVERIALAAPARFVLGFFDQARADRRGPGRHPVVRRAAAGRVVADLPAAVLTCPAWFAADAAVLLAEGRR